MQTSEGFLGAPWRPSATYRAAARARSSLQTVALEVLKGVAGAAEDADADVSGAAFTALRHVLEAAPFLLPPSHAAEDAETAAEAWRVWHPVAWRYHLAEGGGAPAASLSPGHAGGASAAALTGAAAALHERLAHEVSKRLSSRLPMLTARCSRLRPRARAHSLRVLLLLHTRLLADAVRTGPLGGPSAPVVVSDGSAGGHDPASAAAVVSAFVSSLIVPALSRPAGGVGGSGDGAAVSAHPQAGQGADAASLAGAAGAGAPVLFEALRAYVQLSATLCPLLHPGLRARWRTGSEAVADLAAAAGVAAEGAAAAAVGAVLAMGGGAASVSADGGTAGGLQVREAPQQ